MGTRRAILCVVALVLIAGDCIWYRQRVTARNATITYVGIDSLTMMVPAKTPAATLKDGRWSIDPTQALRSVPLHFSAGIEKKYLAFVSLGAVPYYGQAVMVIRRLRAQHLCNVLIRESAEPSPEKRDFGSGPDHVLHIPALVLCGSSIGDAGFSGRLPRDRRVHVY
jgi:hypothetical protein